MASSHTNTYSSQHGYRKTPLLSASKSELRRNAVPHLGTANNEGQKSKVVHDRPSHKLNPKTVDPFNKKTSKSSAFASAYSNGAIPCRLQHGSVKHKLQWSIAPEELNYDPLLITFAEGLQETVHPYAFVAKEGFTQLLSARDAEEKVLPILQRLIPPIKMALMSNDENCFKTTLDALVKLSDLAGSSLNPHLKNLLPQISRKMANKTTKEAILNALQNLEQNGGEECTSIIKSRIPTYSSIL